MKGFALLPGLFVLSVPIHVAATGCHEYYTAPGVKSVRARKWCEEGSYFNFTSHLNKGRSVQAFYRCSANSSKPAIMLGHGWPTSSFDFQRLVALLEDNYFICAVDYIGFGFSDKPPAPYRYSIFEHAELIDLFVRSIVPLKSFIFMTHDEGDSVGLQLLGRYEEMNPPAYTIVHHVMLNGNVYLPLARLTKMQELLLSNGTGPFAQRILPASILATGMSKKLFSPPLSRADAEELATVFAFQHGTHILHETIQYLMERHEFEDHWLAVLGRSPVPTTVVWGLQDSVAVPTVADYVWSNYLANRTSAPAMYHRVADANHYIQTDHPQVIADLVRKLPWDGPLPLVV